MNNQERKQKILQDIARAEKDGFTVIADDWGNQDMRCSCPLGCVNLSNGTRPEDQFDGGVRSLLDVDDNWIQSFIDGFDGNGQADGSRVPEAWMMGQEIRQETKAIDYTDFVNEMDEDNEQGEK